MHSRPPVVAILGHVDHGKTTLLDFIRRSQITAGEHGSITQKIGGYEITTKFKGYKTNKITFIDTPGHEAFSKLRLRGTNVADLALLIIDAKDSVMPQTAESISHILAAKIPLIVVLNKIDLPDAQPEKVKNDLLKYQVMVEGKGGHTPAVAVSAKTGQGIDELLESILLLASDLDITYDPKNPAQAIVIETKKDRRGPIVSVIVRDGSLKIGQYVYVGNKKSKIKSLYDDLGQTLETALPSKPVEILGFEEIPPVGSLITALPQQTATQKVTDPGQKKQPFDLQTVLADQKKEKKLKLIIKTDSFGSMEAIKSSLTPNNKIETVMIAVGDIHKSDVFLAKASQAIVIGFNTQVDNDIKLLAKQEKVIIKTYNIIFELLEELTEVSDLLQQKEETEKNTKGEAKILATFIIENEKVFGIRITKGKITQGDKIDLYRENKPVGKTKVVSLKIRAKKVEEVKKDQEAGIMFYPLLDIRVGDVIKSIL